VEGWCLLLVVAVALPEELPLSLVEMALPELEELLL
jgi:hypothetical protein